MYFRSAPLQNTPPSPRKITARTSRSRDSCSPALPEILRRLDIERVEPLTPRDR
jgi:hypothetical protein